MNRQWLVARATESDPFLFPFLANETPINLLTPLWCESLSLDSIVMPMPRVRIPHNYCELADVNSQPFTAFTA